MPWTPLHAALGETEDALTFDLVLKACEGRVTERADLDWKRDLPLTAVHGEHGKKVAQQSELAKDIAAMANSGGGMIVYGVAQSSSDGTSAAAQVVPVGAVSEDYTKQIRQMVKSAGVVCDG